MVLCKNLSDTEQGLLTQDKFYFEKFGLTVYYFITSGNFSKKNLIDSVIYGGFF